MSRILITPNGAIVSHPLSVDVDVFGQNGADAESGNPIAARYYKNCRPPFAHQHAQHPVRELHHAQYRCDYLRTLAQHPGKLAVQLELHHR